MFLNLFSFFRIIFGLGFITIDPEEIFNNAGGGGGSPGGGSLPEAPVNLANLPVTGGLSGLMGAFLYIGFDTLNQRTQVYSLVINDFNTEEDVEYDFKVEELEPGNEGTVHSIIIRYRDIGVVTFTLAVVSADLPNLDFTKGRGNAVKLTVGNTNPTNKIFTKKVNLKVTTEAPQIKIFKKAGDGPLCITKVKPWISYGDGDII